LKALREEDPTFESGAEKGRKPGYNPDVVFVEAVFSPRDGSAYTWAHLEPGGRTNTPVPGETCEVKIGFPWLETIITHGRVLASTTVGEASSGREFDRSFWRYDLRFDPGQADDEKLEAYVDAARGVKNWDRLVG
jgi:hypothetical protein